MRKRVALLVYVDLDPVPGGLMHTHQSAVDTVGHVLEQRMGYLDPTVVLAPDPLQPRTNQLEGTHS